MTQATLPQSLTLTTLDPVFREDPYPKLWSDPRQGNPGTFMREFLRCGLTEDEEPTYQDFITE
jgi:hypothetical protein